MGHYWGVWHINTSKVPVVGHDVSITAANADNASSVGAHGQRVPNAPGEGIYELQKISLSAIYPVLFPPWEAFREALVGVAAALSA